jgi:hypothetical protein
VKSAQPTSDSTPHLGMKEIRRNKNKEKNKIHTWNIDMCNGGKRRNWIEHRKKETNKQNFV